MDVAAVGSTPVARGVTPRSAPRPEENQVDPRNRLNDLTNREWLLATKSVWFSISPPRDALKARHPATFSEADVARAIRFFTKQGGWVLDPFVGSGSTLVACAETGRNGVGVELSPEWVETADERVRRAVEGASGELSLRVIQGDARAIVGTLGRDQFDFLITSPPYWRILGKTLGQKQRREREGKGLPTRYSDDADDLGNIESYEGFLGSLQQVFAGALPLLRPGAYACVIVSDFRHGPEYYDYHSDVTRLMKTAGYILEGITILAQDNKNLYAYGRPYRFVPNVHHQYLLLFSRPRD